MILRDIDISDNQTPKSITELADEVGLMPTEIHPWGFTTKVKVKIKVLERLVLKLVRRLRLIPNVFYSVNRIKIFWNFGKWKILLVSSIIILVCFFSLLFFSIIFWGIFFTDYFNLDSYKECEISTFQRVMEGIMFGFFHLSS